MKYDAHVCVTRKCNDTKYQCLNLFKNVFTAGAVKQNILSVYFEKSVCQQCSDTNYSILWKVSDQNGISLLYIMLEIHHSGREPLLLETSYPAEQ